MRANSPANTSRALRLPRTLTACFVAAITFLVTRLWLGGRLACHNKRLEVGNDAEKLQRCRDRDGDVDAVRTRRCIAARGDDVRPVGIHQSLALRACGAL